MIDLLTGLFEPEWLSVFMRFRGMFTGNRFAVGWLPPSNVSVAIDAYVRINRAGIRVRAEERALAVLSRARPNLLDDLAKFSKDRDGGEEHPDQRALLTHDSEKQMGFGLWMATLTRYTALALLGDYCRKWLGTSPIDKETFVYRLDRVGPRESETGKATWAKPDYDDPAELIQEAAAKTSAALLLLDRALSEHLGFDHRMARPAPRFLLPLIDLFYRIPATHLKRLSEDCSFLEAVGQLLHWTMLGPYIDQPDLEQLIVEVHGIDEERARERAAPIGDWGPHASGIDAALRDAFQRYQKCLIKIWGGSRSSGHEQVDIGAKELEGKTLVDILNQLALDSFWREINSARSLQHPAVGWVYAIERRGRAREFSWHAQSEGYIQSSAACGVPPATASDRREELLKSWSGDLRASLYPEKQHIVPFAVARQVVGKGGSRSTASASNAIGNLTWLSRRQNGLDALSDRWAVMDRETDAENLQARGFLAKTVEGSSSSDVLELYEDLREIMSAESWRDNQTDALGLYSAFCDSRLFWLHSQMQGWLESPVSTEAGNWLGVSM
ncbi:hypothetical protein [Congregibacter litoralis]|nr:hypothetical protein [Congregibacter litoralis]